MPEAIRKSADCQAKKVRKKKKQRSPSHGHQAVAMGDEPSSSVVVVPDVWCVPGIGFTASASASAAASVDCVVSRRPLVSLPGRAKLDGGKMNHRDREREVFSL